MSPIPVRPAMPGIGKVSEGGVFELMEEITIV